MKRIKKDEYFLALSNLVATRATCDRLHVGCVLAKDGEVVSTGYNGAAPGLPECNQVGHLLVQGKDGKPHCKRSIHAESNALLQAKGRYKNLNGATAYINATPCEICLAELLKWGIKRIVCGSDYKNAERYEERKLLLEVWGAVIEYKPMPDIILRFTDKIEPPKPVQIIREGYE